MTSIARAALDVLATVNARAKAAASREAARAWRSGALDFEFDVEAPGRPARPERPRLLAPRDMPKRRRGGTEQNRIALLHAVAHIELNAIDLAWDAVLRFGRQMPRRFTDDWAGVGDDEARHFLMLEARLNALGSHYGALPAHDGLWQAAHSTSADLLARLAVVPMVLEARGLDVTPGMARRLRDAGDQESAAILDRILADEVEHVRVGTRWFCFLCKEKRIDAESVFQDRVRSHFSGRIKGPFNTRLRTAAGLRPQFYRPLSSDGPD